jgi:hypothetical protein
LSNKRLSWLETDNSDLQGKLKIAIKITNNLSVLKKTASYIEIGFLKTMRPSSSQKMQTEASGLFGNKPNKNMNGTAINHKAKTKYKANH